MVNILILCTGNSCRSQIAEGYFRHFLGSTALVYSAGLEAHGLNPRAVATMKEDGIDISHHTSDVLEKYLNVEFDYILTVCDNAHEHCPYFPGKAIRIHHSFPDPAKATGTEAEINEAFRNVRNQLKHWAEKYSAEIIGKNA
jgi:arsenate reductase